MQNSNFKFIKASNIVIHDIFQTYIKNYPNYFEFYKNHYDSYLNNKKNNDIFEEIIYTCKCEDTTIGFVSFYSLLDKYYFHQEKPITKNNKFKVIYLNKIFSFIPNDEKIKCEDKISILDSIYIFLVTEILKKYYFSDLLFISKADDLFLKFNFESNNKFLKNHFLNYFIDSNNNLLFNELPIKKLDLISILNEINNDDNIKYLYKIIDNSLFNDISYENEIKYKNNYIKILKNNMFEDNDKELKKLNDEFLKNKKDLVDNYVKNFNNHLFKSVIEYVPNNNNYLINILENGRREEKRKLKLETEREILNEKIKFKLKNKS